MGNSFVRRFCRYLKNVISSIFPNIIESPAVVAGGMTHRIGFTERDEPLLVLLRGPKPSLDQLLVV